MKTPIFLVILALLFPSFLIAQNYSKEEVQLFLSELEEVINTTPGVIDLDTTELQSIVQWSEQNRFEEGVLDVHRFLGAYFLELEQSLVALDYLFKARTTAEKLQNTKTEAFILSRIGTAYFKLERLDEAASAYNELLDYYNSSPDANVRSYYVGIALGNLATVELNQGKFEPALEKLLQAYEIFFDTTYASNNDYKINKNKIITNLGGTYLVMNQPQKALPYVEEYLEIMQREQNQREIAKALGNVAYCQYLLGNYAQAYDYYQQSIAVSVEHSFPRVTYVTYKDMSDTYEAEGNYQKALEYFKQYHTLRDSIQGVDVQADLNALKVAHETELKEQEIIRLNQKNQIQRQQLYLTIGGLALLAIISGGMVLLLMNRIKRRKEQAELQALKVEKLNQEIDRKKQDITQLALEISHKQDIANNLVEELSSFKQYVNSSGQKQWRNLEHHVQQQLQTSKEQQLFNENIEAINQDFYYKLGQDFPNLNKSEKELCSYLRLGLSNKEIAAIRNVTPEAIRISRYRLRKKMGFEAKEKVEQFLSTL
ncbi:MAG: tetratricopeptide repeat protein [Bacteroidota bacterium]